MTQPLDIEVPLRYLPEAEMVSMLAARYTKIDTTRPARPHRYAFADHVPSRAWGGERICDFLALDCQSISGPYPHPVHGFEIKGSRSDWLSELRQFDKAEAFKPYCTYWSLVVSDRRIVRPGELPEGWGLLAVAGARLRVIVPAPKLTPQPMPWPLTVAFTRAVAKTARRLETETP